MPPELSAALLAVACGYLIGGIPFAFLVGKLKGIDVRTVGSGNVGATNLGRALGRGWGSLALALDIAKGLLPVLFLAPAIGRWQSGGWPELSAAAMGLSTVLGHVFTPFLLFRGGKGVATTVGAFAALMGPWMLLPLGGYVAVRRLSGFVSAGSIALAVLLPAAAAAARRGDLARGWPSVAAAVVVGLLVLVRHGANIHRLLRGEEHAPGAAPKPSQ